MFNTQLDSLSKHADYISIHYYERVVNPFLKKNINYFTFLYRYWKQSPLQAHTATLISAKML